MLGVAIASYVRAVAHGALACALAIALAIVAAPPSALADPAGDLRAHGDQLAAAGQFDDAAAAYLDAYAASPQPVFVCNAGVAYFKANEISHAYVYLHECDLDDGALPEAFVTAVRENLHQLELQLAASALTPVVFHVEPPSAVIADDDFAPHGAVSPRVIWMDARRHVVTISADGYITKKVEVAPTGKTQQIVDVKLSPVPVTPVVVTRTAPAPRGGLALPIATSAVTIGLVAFSIVASGQAGDAATHADAALTRTAFDRDRGSVDSWNRAVGFGIGAAVVGAAASAYLWQRYARGAPRVELDVKPGVAMLTFSRALAW